MKPIVIALVVFGLLLSHTHTLYALDGVSLSVTTDKEVYMRGSLRTTPIIVTLMIDNTTNHRLRVRNVQVSPVGEPAFGGVAINNIYCQQVVDGVVKFSPRCAISAVQDLIFRATGPTLPSPKPFNPEVILDTWVLYYGPDLAAEIGPHERHALARVEFYAKDFLGPPMPGAYQINGSLQDGSLVDEATGEVLAGHNGSPGDHIHAIAFIKIK